ncbi:MAG TPA: glycosyltransferase [Elusimicrobiota bacterium]|nr:glycosyltransferase [Elusimicrobiota bacterium]
MSRLLRLAVTVLGIFLRRYLYFLTHPARLWDWSVKKLRVRNLYSRSGSASVLPRRNMAVPSQPAPSGALPSRSKPHILYLTPFIPYPPMDGGKKRVLTILQLLADRYRFSVLSFVENQDQVWNAPFMKKWCENVYVVPRNMSEPEGPDAGSLPNIARMCHSAEMVQKLRQVLSSEKFDMVHIEFVQMAQYRPLIKDIPVVFTEHDVSNMSFFKSYFREMTGWERWKRIGEWMRLVKYQMDSCREMDGVVTVTPHDRDKLLSFMPSVRVESITTGVDLTHFKFRSALAKKMKSGEANLVYVGHYLHYPNEDAILYFAREVFPRIVRQCPIARLWVVGSGPTEAVKELEKDSRIRVTGAVPDVLPYIEKADIFVAPLRLGEGIKGKILEAMAVGVPVVTTPVGAWGLDVEPGRDLLVGRTPQEFADETVRLIFDRELRKQLIRRGRQLVVQNYSWHNLADQLDGFYRSILEKKTAQ